MKHLTVRVAWHASRWNGTVCPAASQNAYCVELDRIRDGRDDVYEDSVGGVHFADLPFERQPPCRVEVGAFMSDREIAQLRVHPYADLPKARATHGMLQPTIVRSPPYSVLAVPFWSMLRGNQDAIEAGLPEALPPDVEPPFPSAWVFASARQEALGRLFFDEVGAHESLLFCYTKSGHPLGDHINRLVVGHRVGHRGGSYALLRVADLTDLPAMGPSGDALHPL